MSLEPRAFPAEFRWGAATSAHQVEGGNHANDWWRFEQTPGHIRGGDRSGDACLHAEVFERDFDLAAADGHTMHRLSLEWSRIEPERGRIDPAAVAHYHAVLAALRARGIEPCVTLWHFTLPVWVADRGGWESRETLDRFDAFVRFCAREYGARVDWWCTVNEPEVYAFRAYSEGIWPPGSRDDSAALLVLSNLLEAHARAARILRDEDRADADGDGHAVRVGFAKHVVTLEPLRTWSPFDQVRARAEDALFNTAVLRAPATGTVELSIPGARPVRRDIAGLAGSLDWIGVNYYTRWKVRMFAREPHVVAPGAPRTDLGWEIHPRGFEQALVRAHVTTGAPVLVTENGFADAADAFRPRALVDHVLAMGRAMDHGVPVLGYLHWSLLDNFEWADGFHGRFGLYRVDFGSPARTRTRTRSAEVLADLARANALTSDILAEAGEPGA
jgi:beta-glucosidase